MKKSQIEVHHWNDVNCFWSAVSILRLALGYPSKIPLRPGKKRDPKANIEWALKNAGKFFPEHEVFTWGNNESAHHHLDFKVFMTDPGDFVWMYGFSTYEHVARRVLTTGSAEVENHTVIGLPTIYEGMFPTYALKVKVGGKRKK